MLKNDKNDMAGYKTLYTVEIGLGSLSQEGLAIFYHWAERFISSKRIYQPTRKFPD